MRGAGAVRGDCDPHRGPVLVLLLTAISSSSIVVVTAGRRSGWCVCRFVVLWVRIVLSSSNDLPRLGYV